MNNGWIYRNQVDSTAHGWQVLDYYIRHYRHSTPAEWQARVEAGQILLEGAKTTAETNLRQGKWLTYHRSPWQEPEVPLAFTSVYEDSDVLVVAKPAGLPVLPGGGFLEHTLLRQLQHHYPQETPLPIHRLGRGTSGLVLLARSPLARSGLSQQMRDRQIRKIYRALVGCGSMPDTFAITQSIGKIPHPMGYLYAVCADGLSAQSNCRVLKRTLNTTLLEVEILTGRPHQIRIHLAAAGYPLVGDPLYGVGGLPIATESTTPVPGDCGYHLHAMQLTFTHPSSGQTINVMCPPPSELEL